MFSLDCNVTTKGLYGVIEIPSQDGMGMSECAWTIIAPKGSRVNMTFTSLNVVKSSFNLDNVVFRRKKVQYAVDNNYCNNTQLIVSARIFFIKLE